jgi:transposase
MAGNTCNYALNQRNRLMAFPEDGRIEIYSNWRENDIRPMVPGRKNWLQIGNALAGPRAAAIVSVMKRKKAGRSSPAFLKNSNL